MTTSGDVHFTWCCQAILRRVIVQSDPGLAEELDQVEKKLAGTQQMGKLQERKAKQDAVRGYLEFSILI
jgi:hypothetical protein